MARFFGLFDYTKPGPGVDKNEPRKNRFFLFWEIYGRRFWKLIALNFIFILFCIPVVTIGPAIAGMTYVLRNFSQEKHAYPFSDFLDAFKKNWKQSAVYWFLSTVFWLILIYNTLFYFENASVSDIWMIPLGVCIFLIVLFLFMNYYAYLMIVTVNLKMKNIFKNSFLLACLGLKSNIVITLFLALLFAFFFFIPLPLEFSIILFCTLFLSTAGLIICYNAYPMIERYVIDPGYHEEATDGTGQESGEKPVFTDMGAEKIPVQTEDPKKGRTIK